MVSSLPVSIDFGNPRSCRGCQSVIEENQSQNLVIQAVSVIIGIKPPQKHKEH